MLKNVAFLITPLKRAQLEFSNGMPNIPYLIMVLRYEALKIIASLSFLFFH